MALHFRGLKRRLTELAQRPGPGTLRKMSRRVLTYVLSFVD